MIACTDVCVRTEDGVELLREVTLTIDRPRTAIIGANGSGKTTLARLLNGLTPASSGTVTVDGVDVAANRREVQRRVGFVFANADHQLVYPTPVEDVALSLRARGVAQRDARARALEQLAAVGLAHKADQGVHTLSGGEKHLVALCAVLVLEPHWLIVDEPTTTLDLVNRRRVVDVLATLPQRLVVVSHDLDLVREMDTAVVVHDARVFATGSSDEMIACYRSLIGVA